MRRVIQPSESFDCTIKCSGALQPDIPCVPITFISQMSESFGVYQNNSQLQSNSDALSGALIALFCALIVLLVAFFIYMFKWNPNAQLSWLVSEWPDAYGVSSVVYATGIVPSAASNHPSAIVVVAA